MTNAQGYITLGRDGRPLPLGPGDVYVTLKLFSVREDPNSDGLLFEECPEIVPASLAQVVVQSRYNGTHTAVHVDTLKQYPNTRL